MSKLTVKLLATLCCIFCSIGSKVYGQAVAYDPSLFINININSGNPTCPYPQFLEYTGGGKSLAKYNAEGVTHADMEKAGRESYEIMMHRCRYMGGTHCGVQYITFNHESVPGNYGTFVSEGDGYALLAAAIFADQKTFNGLYMWVHDHRFSGVERFQDGRVLRGTENDFAGPYLAGWQCDETTTSMSPCHSATDGDVDIAMAMLIAYKQWGEFMMQDGKVVTDYSGKPISLKYEAQRVIGALVDTIPQWDKGSGKISGYINGVIGIDGYEKRGNSWGELTRWRFTDEANALYPGVNGPYNGGPNLYGIYGANYIDYDAPSYFEEFWRWLKNGDGADENNKKNSDWEIHQFKRAAASGNWLNKKAYEQGLYASIGMVSMTEDGNPEFGVYVDGEDFRYPWRHMMDYLWHGNSDYDWDPKTHQVITGSNTSERDMGIRHAELLKAPLDGPGGDPICKPMGASPDPGQPYWSGVSQIPQQWRPDGGMTSAYHTNYSPGAGSPAAVISEDLDLLADIYRQCEIMWDGNNTAAKLDPEERYIGSTPKYFHGWFRTLGMLVCSGNLLAPEQMKPFANVKVYMSVDKTYAYQGDNVTYGVQYRNFGTLAAQGTQITTKLDPNYDFVSATKGGKYNSASHSITWNIGEIPGFKSGGLAATMDSVAFTVNVRDTLNKRICLTSTISGANFDNWVSNEYPNHATYTMERNCVDILANRSLFIKKKANRNALNPKDVVTFTVEFGNESKGEDGWMNGGRDNVRISYGTYTPNPCYQFYSLYRFWNDSYESYINMGNYRVSYFMYDAAAIGLQSDKNPTGWTFVVDNQNDLDKYGYNPESGPITFAYQKIPQGSDEHGKWNQRLMIRFADVLMAPSTHVYDKLDSQYLLHKGVWGPGFIRARLASNPASDLSTRVTDDWSYDPKVGEKSLDGQGTTFTLISPCWANYDDPGYEIDNYSRHVCKPTSVGNYERILVEEFDGYTWRRIQGTGPLPGKEAYNVTVVDTIPYELEWVGWVDSTALKDEAGVKIQATYKPHSGKDYTGVVYWTIPTMLVGETDKLVYKCKARDLGCPDVEDTYYKNVAWIWSDTDSPDSSQVDLMTSCSELPPMIEPQTSLFKRADRKKAEVGETVGYTVSFVNTLGTRVDADCKTTTGWQKLGTGNLPAVGSDGLKLSTNGTSAYFFGPEKSYGTDGSVYATIGGEPSSTQNLFIVFRYNGGTPGKADFKGVCMQMMVNKDGKNNFGYYLYNNGDLIASEGLTWADAMQFPGDNKAPTFKFVLNGDHLYMYVNDQEDEWTNVSKDWSGLTATDPGFFGMYVNSNGNANTQLTSFITELDYAFDITLSDVLPAELGNVNEISDDGVWDEKKNVITWPTVAKTAKEALAPGDSVVRTFEAEVVSCDKYISNMGVATVYGLDSLKVLNTIECGAVECDLTEVVASLALEAICDGDSTYIKAVATPKSKSYTYEFFSGKTSLNEKPIKADSFFVKEAGSYSVTVYNEEIPGCKLSSDPVKLTVNPLPAEVLENGVALCEGEGLDLSKATIDGYDLKWYSEETATIEVEDLNIDGQVVLGAYFYTVTDKTTKCTGEIQMMEVSKEAIPAVPTVTSPKEFAVGAGKEDITKLATSEDGRVVWYESETSTDSLRTPIMVSVATEDTITYYVSAISKGGCESEREKVVIYITSSNKPKVSDTTLCIGETVDVTALVETPEKGQTLIWCDASGAPVDEPTPFKSETPGETKYYVKSTNGTAESDVAEITITTVGVGSAITAPVSYCEDATAEKLVATTDESSLSEYVKADNASKFEWYLGGVKLDEDALIPSTSKVSSTTTNTYKVVPTYTIAKDHVCKGDTTTLDVTVKHIDAPAVNNVITYTLGDTLTDGTFKNLLAQDESAVTPGKDMTLVWYDEDMNELTSAPVPTADKSMTTDVKLKYYVSQKDEDGCESVLSDVDVIISLTPVPKTKVARFCEDVAVAESIENYVEKTEATYTLKWYDADKAKGGAEIATPTISTSKTSSQPTDTTTYFVCQVDEGGAESSTVPVKVIVYARPQLKTHFDTVCSRAVNLDTMWVVSNDVSNVYSSFTDESGAPLSNPTAIDKTGHYAVTGYFKMPNDTTIKCQSSTPEEIYVEIHRIDSLSIVGASSACPDASVELDALVKGDIYDADLTYTWNLTNNSTKPETGNFVSDALTKPTKFEVTVSDGFCTKKTDHTVNIGQGEVKGSIVFADKSGNTETIAAHGDPISFYVCGESYTLLADLESDDNKFNWSNGETAQRISLTEAGEYEVTFVNECETSQKIVVYDAGIKNNTKGYSLILCEGDKKEMALDYTCNETASVEWQLEGSPVSSSNPILIESTKMSDAGVYTYTITNRNCVVEDTFGVLTVYETPKFTKIADDTTICDGSMVAIGLSSLSPSTAYVTWDTIDNKRYDGMEIAVSPTEKTVYRFTVMPYRHSPIFGELGCKVVDSIVVDVEEQIEFSANPTDTTVCMTANKFNLSTNITAGKPRKYSWKNEAGDELSTSPIFKAPADLIGESVYTVSLSNGVCESVTAKSAVKVVGYPTIESVDQKGYRDVIIIPSANNESTDVMYKVDNGEFQTSENFSDLKYGSHTAYIVDEYGCKSDFQFTTEAPGIEFPSVVTPNNDGVNDGFISETVSAAYPDAKVVIFDRYGKKLTEIKGDESWDGTYLGKKMPSTDYWYEIWIEEIRKKYVGHFTLIND